MNEWMIALLVFGIPVGICVWMSVASELHSRNIDLAEDEREMKENIKKKAQEKAKKIQERQILKKEKDIVRREKIIDLQNREKALKEMRDED